jgi:anti-sigma factor RsiW
MAGENGTLIELALCRFLDGEPEPDDGAALAAAMAKDDRLADEVCRLLVVDDLLRQAVELDPAAFAEALQTRLAA